MIRIILRRYKYPPDEQFEAIQMVMQQAEVLSDEWTQDEDSAPLPSYGVNNVEMEGALRAAEPKDGYGCKKDT